MAAIKPRIAKKKPTVAIHAQTRPSRGRPGKRHWIIFPLGAMVIVCMSLIVLKSYALIRLPLPSLYDTLWFPPFPALLVTIFGIAYIYKISQRKPVGKTANIIASVLLAIFGIFIIIIGVIIAGKGHICSGFFEMSSDCSEVGALMLYTFFGNPYSLVLISSLALAGSAALFVVPGKSNANKS